MDIRITQKQKNPVLQREEIAFEIKETKATPTRKDIREKLAALSGVKPELVIVEKISTRFGETNATGTALIYGDEKRLAKTELEHLVNKSAGIKGKKNKEAQAAPKK